MTAVNDVGVRDAIRALTAALDITAAHTTTVARTYRIGGDRWTIRMTADSKVERLLDACAPLRTHDAQAAELELFIWNDAVDRVALPDSAVLRREFAPADGLGGYSDAASHAFFQPDAGVLSMLDVDRRRAHWWLRDASTTPYFERAAPFKHIVQWWTAARGGALLHSAAIAQGEGDATRGVLISGPSGSGKSSTALACLASGLGFTSDDYVVVDGGEPPRVHLAYSTAKVLRGDLPRFADYTAHFRNLVNADEKPMMFVDQFAPASIRISFAPIAFVLPQVAHARRTRFVPIHAAEMLRALAPSSVLLFPLAGARSLQRMARLCTQLPCLRAELADDPRDVGEAFSGLIADPAAHGMRAVA
ncbi:MAG TPA: hypothetical protein VGR63_04460 [Casimicrobiaceae bacterium]|nr:hypothetical protein [Casimicrobiaceae bacterium]